MIGKLITLLAVLLIFFAGGLFVLHWYSNQGFLQKTFVKGKVPERKPDGFYPGEVESFNIHTPWLGKEFNSKQKTGINILRAGDKKEKKFPFKTYVDDGLVDKDLKVIKIDYNISQNPLWLRPLVDEVVMLATDDYLGKIEYKLPYIPAFTLGFFSLKK